MIPEGADPFVTLFSESAGREVVAVPRSEELRFTDMCGARGLPATRIGVIDGAEIDVQGQFSISLSELRVTPGVGVRMPSLLGPIRLDIGFNPYPSQKGPLYQQVGPDLKLIDAAYAPSLRFIDRLQLHLSIGQAF